MTTYSFLDVNCSIVGPGGLIDLAAGAASAEEGITIEAANDINTMMIGADGAVMHSLHGDKSGMVTVRLLKTSPKNAQLSAMYALQTASSRNHGKNVISLNNSLSGDTITSQLCAFQKAPALNYAKDADIVEWVWQAGVIDRTLGQGN